MGVSDIATTPLVVRAPRWPTAGVLGAIAIILYLVVASNPGLVRFWPFSAAEFVQAMTPLLLISLFVERALEIVIKGVRGGEEEKRARAAAADPTQADALTDYKAQTRAFAFGAALLICIIISAVGVRALELVTDPAVFKALTSAQRSAFQVIDVLLTGALLAGGADGLHKIVTLFTDNIDALKKRAKSGASA